VAEFKGMFYRWLPDHTNNIERPGRTQRARLGGRTPQELHGNQPGEKEAGWSAKTRTGRARLPPSRAPRQGELFQTKSFATEDTEVTESKESGRFPRSCVPLRPSAFSAVQLFW